MRERELRDLAVCKMCGKKLGASFRDNNTLPIFWKVRISRHILDDRAMRRQAGLEMMMGGHVGLARALSPDEEMTKTLMDEKTISICEHCALEGRIPLGALAMDDERESEPDSPEANSNDGHVIKPGEE